jgi:hypothetical protein
MAKAKDPNSVCSFIESQMEANPDVTVNELITALKRNSLRASRHYIHSMRNRYWNKYPERKPKARRPDHEAAFSSTQWNQGQRTLKRHCVVLGPGISYSFFGFLDEANQLFLLEELQAMQDSTTIADWLASLITDARLDKEELEETKRRVKSWQTET